MKSMSKDEFFKKSSTFTQLVADSTTFLLNNEKNLNEIIFYLCTQEEARHAMILAYKTLEEVKK